MKTTTMRLLASITILTICQISIAQEEDDLLSLSLEDLMNMDVISASKTSEKLTDAPGVIQVITAEEIERFGALNLAEVLDRVTGAMNMSSITYPQNITSIRGDLANEFDTHVLLLMNGRPMRESVYGGLNSPIYLGFPLTIIDRIEVIRGPGSVLYGSNAYTGVVNIITKKVEETGGSVRITGGSFGTFDATGDFSVVKEDFTMIGAFKSYDEEGWEFTATDILGDTRTIDYLENNQSFAVNAQYKQLTINALHTKSNQRFFSYVSPVWDLGTPEIIPENKTAEFTRQLVDVGYELNFNENFTSNVNMTYSGFIRRTNILGVTTNDGSQGSSDWLGEVSNFYSPSENVNILFGGTIYKQTGRIIDAGLLDYNNSWYSAYSQIDYRPIDRLKLIAGVQFNAIEGLDNDFVPRVGAIFNITESLGTKLLYSQSFRAPYAAETKANVPGFAISNPNLEAEKLSNLDIQFFYTKSKFELYATYFNYTSANLITQAPLDPTGVDPTITFVNLNASSGLVEGDPTGFGYSIEGKFIPNKNIYITGSYSHQENEQDISGFGTLENFTYMPNDMFKLGVSYQSTDKAFSIGAFNSYISTFNDNYADVRPTAPANEEFDSMNLLSVNLSLNLPTIFKSEMKEDVILSVYGTNILNESVNYPDFTARLINSIPGRAGAAFYGSLAIKF